MVRLIFRLFCVWPLWVLAPYEGAAYQLEVHAGGDSENAKIQSENESEVPPQSSFVEEGEMEGTSYNLWVLCTSGFKLILGGLGAAVATSNRI